MDKRRLYSPEEDEYIRQHYLITAHEDIAAELGRSVGSIRHRAAKLGCPRAKQCRRWTSEEDEVILTSKGRPLEEVSENLGRDPSDVLKRAKKLGWKSWRRPDGGQYIDSRGYAVREFIGQKPVLEHRAVMESIIGRHLTDKERVHHIDMDKRNNSPENLFLFASPREHLLCHNSLNAILDGRTNVAELLRQGKIRFDRNKGMYK